MKPLIFKCILLIIFCCFFTSSITGCDLRNKSGNQIVNEYLASNNAINDLKTQPVIPGSGEFFAEGAKIFDLTAIPDVKMLNSSGMSSGRPIKLFSPSSSPALHKVLSGSPAPSFYRAEAVQSEIPSTKSHDVIPEQCQGLEDQDQSDCMNDAKDNDNGTTTMCDEEHHSYHDAGTLEAQLGPDIENKIIN